MSRLLRRWSAMRASDRGSSVLELAVIAPAILLLIVFMVYAGRTVVAKNAINQAAEAAARQASVATTVGEAQTQAITAATQSLQSGNLHCASLTVTIDTTQWSAGIGQPAVVTAHVRCVVNLSDLVVPGVPGQQVETAEFTSPLDAYGDRVRG